MSDDRDYADEMAKHESWPIGDTPSGTGTPRPMEDVGSSGTESENHGLNSFTGRPGAPLGGASDPGRFERGEDRIDADAGGGLNQAAVGAAGLGAGSARSSAGTDDLGAAAGKDLGSGLGGSRGGSQHEPRGDISGVGGTRGSGEGTGHLETTVG